MVGYQSGYSNVSGDYNSFFGYASEKNNSDGQKNSFMGSYAGYSNTSGRIIFSSPKEWHDNG
ncbi:MAG: hypothetical protein KJ607_15085 [Bacteroidetes bacterium]|nr:hypothetical protein [Bacteroidota bacterium]